MYITTYWAVLAALKSPETKTSGKHPKEQLIYNPLLQIMTNRTPCSSHLSINNKPTGQENMQAVIFWLPTFVHGRHMHMHMIQSNCCTDILQYNFICPIQKLTNKNEFDHSNHLFVLIKHVSIQISHLIFKSANFRVINYLSNITCNFHAVDFTSIHMPDHVIMGSILSKRIIQDTQ